MLRRALKSVYEFKHFEDYNPSSQLCKQDPVKLSRLSSFSRFKTTQNEKKAKGTSRFSRLQIFFTNYKERASTRNVGAVFNREIKCRGCKPLPLKFSKC